MSGSNGSVPARRGRVLVIRGGAIGDFILTLPVLAALRAHLPSIHLEVLGYAHIASLAVAGGTADAVRSIEARALAGFFAPHGELDPALQDYFASFSLIISFLYDPEETFQQNIARCSKAQFIQGPHRPSDTAGLHATEVLLQPLQRLAIFDADPVPRLPRLRLDPTTGPSSPAPDPGSPNPDQAPDRATDTRPIVVRPPRSSGPIVLHPGSGSPRKNWPEEHWATLIQRLTESLPHDAAPLHLVGGEAEGDRLARLSALARGHATVADRLPLPELARQIAPARLFVGHDSGITHLAAALDVPCLALWGETADAVWRPRGDHVRLVHSRHLPGGLAGLPVQTVLEAIAGR